MKNPIVLHRCKTSLDAYYIKNIIQTIRAVPVSIKRRHREIVLVVEYAHCDNAIIILNNVLPMIPSNLVKSKQIEAVETVTESVLDYQKGLDYLLLKAFEYTKYATSYNLF